MSVEIYKVNNFKFIKVKKNEANTNNDLNSIFY